MTLNVAGAGGYALGPPGALAGLAIDLLAERQRSQAALEQFRQYRGLLGRGGAMTREALAAQLFEQRAQVVRQQDQLQRANLLTRSLAETTTLASGIEGRTFEAATRTRLLQEAEVRTQAAQALRNLDAQYGREVASEGLQRLFQLQQALWELQSQRATPLDFLAGGMGIYAGLKQGGHLDAPVDMSAYDEGEGA